LKSKKQTISQLNQVQTEVTKSKLESEVKTHSKEMKKINNKNFYRALEAFSDCV